MSEAVQDPSPGDHKEEHAQATLKASPGDDDAITDDPLRDEDLSVEVEVDVRAASVPGVFSDVHFNGMDYQVQVKVSPEQVVGVGIALKSDKPGPLDVLFARCGVLRGDGSLMVKDFAGPSDDEPSYWQLIVFENRDQVRSQPSVWTMAGLREVGAIRSSKFTVVVHFRQAPDEVLQAVHQVLSRQQQAERAQAAKSAAKPTFLEDFMLAGAAATLSKTLACPLDNAKLLVQSGRYDTMFQAFANVDFMLLFRGNTINVLAYFPTQAFNFAFKDNIKAMFKRSRLRRSFPFLNSILAGGLSGVLSLCFVYPMHLTRCVLATDVQAPLLFSSGFDVVRRSLTSLPVSAMYAGFLPSLFGIFAYRGSYFGLYDTFRPTDPNTPVLQRFMFGYAVTVAAGLLSYPIDTIRRTMMWHCADRIRALEMQGDAAAAEDWHMLSTWEATQQIYQDGGVAGFWAGAGANMLRGIAGAAVLAWYDTVRNSPRRKQLVAGTLGAVAGVTGLCWWRERSLASL